uniref:Uncharacterized protein n=1 Tax=Anguilla anguilla TaxID=7936 RepID=A0A0E9SBE7_ANGAN
MVSLSQEEQAPALHFKGYRVHSITRS